MHHSKPALLALLALTAGVHAAGEGSDSRFSLGIAAGYTGGVYKDYDGNHWHAAPLLHYESPHIYLDGASAGVKLYNSETQTLTLGASYDGNAFKPNRSRDPRLQQLDRRKSGINADLGYRLDTGYGSLQTTLSQDISGNSKGTQIEVQYGYTWAVSPQLAITPAVGATWADKKYNRYYYGVSETEAARSGLSAYHAKGGISPYVDLSAQYHISPHISAFAGVRAEKLSGAVKDSPMTEKKAAYSGMIGATYNF